MQYTILLHTLFPYLISFFIFLLFLEQISYLKKKRNLPGPTFVLPFLGNAVSLVRNPTRFWDNQSSLATSSGLSANYLAGNFILFVRDTALSHVVFANVIPDAFTLVGHPFGKKLFGEHNLIYMTGQEHKDLRRRIAPNFTPKALVTYTAQPALQQIIILDHLKKWVDDHVSSGGSDPITLRYLVRDMNLETSQTVFVGPYLRTEARERFKSDYNFFNVGLMKLPVDLPGTAFRNPEVLAKVREEVAEIWDPESNALITADQLAGMKYTHAVAREVVRYRAPATMVPHIAAVDFPLTERYTVPKGTIVFPSAYESCFQGFTEPDRFDPDRFSEERQEDRTYKKNYLAFGAGAHQCVGQRYAVNHLVLFIAMFVTLIDLKRHRTEGCDDMSFVPTICPDDMSQRRLQGLPLHVMQTLS